MDEKMKHSSDTKETRENSKEAMNTVDRLESFCLQSKKIFTKARLKKPLPDCRGHRRRRLDLLPPSAGNRPS